MEEYIWHNLPLEKVYKHLKTNRSGLVKDAVNERLQKFGENKLPEPQRVSSWKIFLYQFKSPLVYILFFASLISILLRSWLDLSIILAVVIANAVIGYIQESKANKSIDMLKHLVHYNAKVLRDGNERQVSTTELVPGDIIFLEAGDRVPADARLVESKELTSIEASLTGESSPSKKSPGEKEKGTVLADRENMVYMGTVVNKGRAVAIVCETGTNTELGKIATLISGTKEEKTPLQLQLAKLSRLITIIVVSISILIIVLGIATGQELFQTIDGHEAGILYTGIALAVAAIPEGLLIAVTVILVLGMQRILKQKALIRKLIATETLGSTSVICTDKTGTLTEGRMMVVTLALADFEMKFHEALNEKNRKHFEDIMRVSMLCNNASLEDSEKDIAHWNVFGDSTDVAVYMAASQFGFVKKNLSKEYPRMDEIQFDSEHKYMATLNKEGGSRIMNVKGSPEVILGNCSSVMIGGKSEKITKSRYEHLKHQYETLTKKGLRLLAVAKKKVKSEEISHDDVAELTLLGFMGIKDPLRKETKKMYGLTKIAGIRTVVVTGDHKFTARSIAQEMGMKVEEENILEGGHLDKMSDDKLEKDIRKYKIFARVNPHHKLRIIDAWRKRGEVVAMTGDGVNDAPALKSADVGIALNSGTDVAKQNADIILLDNNFKTIVEAIKEGRNIFNNIRKVLLYLLSDSFAEITLITGALVLGLPLPILPVQILWVNLIDDGMPAMAMTLEKGEKDILNNPPRKKDEPVLNLEIKILILIIGVAVNIVLLGIYIWFLRKRPDYSIVHVRTIIFTTLAISTLLYAYSCRSLKSSVLRRDIFSNKYLNYSVILGVLLQSLAVYEPHLQKAFDTVSLGLFDWGIVLGVSVLSIILIEATKYFLVVRRKENV